MNNTPDFDDPFEFCNHYQGGDKAKQYVDRITVYLRKSGLSQVADSFILTHYYIKTKTFPPLRNSTKRSYKKMDKK